ncbi:MAG: molybdopterin molybdotransferase MoeA [Gemmatimonadales bacterium]
MKIVAVREAIDAIVARVRPQPSLRIPLTDASGQALADDLIAPFALPRWTNAAMDGYAVRGNDIRGARRDRAVRLTVREVVAAGMFPVAALGPGEAARIFTGAPLPPGADSVIRQEDTDRGNAEVQIFDDRDAGANVRAAGADIAEGELALPAGTVLAARHIALLAALGLATPLVRRRPRVALLSTGDEIAPLDQLESIRSGARLADVNTAALLVLVNDAGGIPVPLGIAGDTPGALRTAIAANDDWDLLITAGGASVGDHDHVRATMAALDVALDFERVRVRPGGPTAFGSLPDGRPWLALPGNPVSAMVTFELFGATAIRATAGHRTPATPRIVVRNAADLRPDPVLEQYLRCRLEPERDGTAPIATVAASQGSGMIATMARADALLALPAGNGVVSSGTLLEAIDLRCRTRGVA